MIIFNSSSSDNDIKTQKTSGIDAFIKKLFHYFTNLFFKQHIVMAHFLVRKYIIDQRKNPVKILHHLIHNDYHYFTSMIGFFYQYGIGTFVDYQIAFEYYSRAANDYRSNQQHQFLKDSISSHLLESFIKFNRINGRIFLASLYIDGKGVKQDKRLAFQILFKTASEGSSRAVNYLGFCFEKGYWVEKNSCKAFELYSKAEEKGHLVARCNLGYSYQDGVGTVKDEIKGFQYYLKAAMEGNIVAKYCVAWCFENGQGVERDHKIAYYWYMKSANEGYNSSQSNIAYCYGIGQGIFQDEKKAFQWYQEAGKNGNILSQRVTGIRYMYGTGVKRDVIKAIQWLTKAADNGDSGAEDELDDFEVNLIFQN